MDWRVVQLAPPGYVHYRAFDEIAETLVLALRSLGLKAVRAVNEFAHGEMNIVLGGHLLGHDMVNRLPASTVFYNLEQVEDELFETYPVLRELFARYEVWDYSPRNREKLRSWVPRLHLLPVGCMPQLDRIVPAADQDIDVLFYGATNERRDRILEEVGGSGLRLHSAFGVYGAERDALIARSKLVLNIHQRSSKVFEIVRISYLLTNRKAVVSELAADTEIEAGLADAVLTAPYDGLVAACRTLIDDDGLRRALEERGNRRMMERRQPDFLKALLAKRG